MFLTTLLRSLIFLPTVASLLIGSPVLVSGESLAGEKCAKICCCETVTQIPCRCGMESSSDETPVAPCVCEQPLETPVPLSPPELRTVRLGATADFLSIVAADSAKASHLWERTPTPLNSAAAPLCLLHCAWLT